MILTCPACGTQYAVKDGAVPPGGRQVRCAACKHRWHQDPEAGAAEDELLDSEAAATDADAPEASSGGDEAEPGAADARPDSGEDNPQPPPGYAAVDPIAPPEEPSDPAGSAADPVDPGDSDEGRQGEWRPRGEDDEFSPFVSFPEERDRSSPLRKLLILLLVLALLALAFWFLAPAEWKARVGLAESSQTPLQLMMTHSDRQQLASGNELLAVSGRVINPTGESQPVPPIQAQLHSSSGQLVYSWTIAPPARTLAPGQSATFNSAEVNVPAGGDELTISLGPPRA